jgi:hypothetical protein
MQCCGHAHGSSVLERHWWLPVYWSAPHRLLLLRSCCIGISHTLSLTLHTAIHIGTTLCIPTTDSLPLSRLGCIVLRDNNAAFTAALLFCVTPANIHMSAVYVCRILFFTARSHCVMTKRLVSRMSYLISRIWLYQLLGESIRCPFVRWLVSIGMWSRSRRHYCVGTDQWCSLQWIVVCMVLCVSIHPPSALATSKQMAATCMFD